jgi:hypothetical protein
VTERGLNRDDLIFQAPALNEPRIRKLRLVADPDSLGRTEPNPEGHTYRHGTMTAYTLGRCRCDYCRGAYASYRATRRAQGKDSPGRPRTLDTDRRVPGQWFRESVWLPAISAAGLEIQVRLHDLRHAHASWLPAAPISRSCASASATAACAPLSATCTPCPTPTKPPSTP